MSSSPKLKKIFGKVIEKIEEDTYLVLTRTGAIGICSEKKLLLNTVYLFLSPINLKDNIIFRTRFRYKPMESKEVVNGDISVLDRETVEVGLKEVKASSASSPKVKKIFGKVIEKIEEDTYLVLTRTGTIGISCPEKKLLPNTVYLFLSPLNLKDNIIFKTRSCFKPMKSKEVVNGDISVLDREAVEVSLKEVKASSAAELTTPDNKSTSDPGETINVPIFTSGPSKLKPSDERMMFGKLQKVQKGTFSREQSPRSTMEAEDNLVETEERNEYKSVEELEKVVNAKQSRIHSMWKLKKKEKRSWERGLPQDEVGWCEDHQDFCDIVGKCNPWDPFPATSEEG